MEEKKINVLILFFAHWGSFIRLFKMIKCELEQENVENPGQKKTKTKTKTETKAAEKHYIIEL